METMTMTNQYDEVHDLHPRVKHLMSINNWCSVSEFRVTRGQLDFAGIKRDTGTVAIVECKISVSDANLVIAQINRYHEAFGVPVAEKRLAVIAPPTDPQIDALIANNIEIYLIDMDTPAMGRHMGDHAWEFVYWFKFWKHEVLPEGTVHQWLNSPIYQTRLPLIEEPAPFGKSRPPTFSSGYERPVSVFGSLPVTSSPFALKDNED
jgi:hypothetical protein